MKKTPGQTDEEREKYWTEIIEAARGHAAGITAYLKARGIEKNNYYKWFQRLKASHPEWIDLSTDQQNRRAQPKTEVVEKASRRRFSSQEKRRILEAVDNAGPGNGASILRKEGIYSSQLHEWRLQKASGALEPRKRGPKTNPTAQEVKRLQAQLAKTKKQLAQANALIDLQKKVAEILKTSLDEDENDE